MAKLLKTLGYSPLTSNVATYYSTIDKIIVVTHVDDCLLIGPSITKINALKAQLAKAYDIEDLGSARYFLEIEIHRNKSYRLLWINQKAYIE